MKPMSKKGILIVVSGPSGGGKGTVVRRMREMLPEIGFSVSATTRPPRTGEVDGEDYYFITREKFTAMIGGGEMLEHTEYCGNFYGTPRAEVERVTDSGRDMILEIEVDGDGGEVLAMMACALAEAIKGCVKPGCWPRVLEKITAAMWADLDDWEPAPKPEVHP